MDRKHFLKGSEASRPCCCGTSNSNTPRSYTFSKHANGAERTQRSVPFARKEAAVAPLAFSAASVCLLRAEKMWGGRRRRSLTGYEISDLPHPPSLFSIGLICISYRAPFIKKKEKYPAQTAGGTEKCAFVWLSARKRWRVRAGVCVRARRAAPFKTAPGRRHGSVWILKLAFRGGSG